MRIVLAAGLVAVAAVLACSISDAYGAVIAPYVVVLDDRVDVATTVDGLERAHGFVADHRYSASIAGFAARLSSRQRDAIARDAAVAAIHEDRPALLPPARRTTRSAPLATGVKRIGGGTKAAAGVAIAVLDTGVDLTHPDLSAGPGTSCVGGGARKTASVTDGNGHGTHVIGTIAGRRGLGVAPNTTVYAVKVLDDQGRGSTSQLICGIDWVTANATRLGIRVASLSLGTPGVADTTCGRTSRDVLHKAICKATAAGVLFVVAAGNDAADIAETIPSGYPEVLAVSAMSDSDGAAGARGGPTACGERQPDDTAASFSNYASSASDAGHLTAAPGVCIRSAWPGGGTRTISGTSMAAPHVAATVALCIASGQCAGSPAETITQIRADAASHGAGFTGDEHAPLGRRHYGDLVWAGSY